MLKRPVSQSGVSMIESLISLVVISIGLLGLAALQINSLKNNSSAYFHTQAIMMAHNMADRIRANQVQILNYVGIDTENDYDQDCMAQACNAAAMREADATEWKALVSTIPAGRGIIRAPVNNQLDIVVMWDDEGSGATGTGCSSDTQVDLSCYTVTMRTP
jgi:type IV pilus assembly protein PilV